jgi:hypothetical protein
VLAGRLISAASAAVFAAQALTIDFQYGSNLAHPKYGAFTSGGGPPRYEICLTPPLSELETVVPNFP